MSESQVRKKKPQKNEDSTAKLAVLWGWTEFELNASAGALVC